MSHSQTAHGNDKPADKPAEAAKPAAKKSRDKAHDGQMAFALLLTDWLHGDRHFQGKLMELAHALLEDLSGGPDVKDPDEDQILALEAAGRLEGMPTGIRAAQSQPAMRIDEARQPAPTKAA